MMVAQQLLNCMIFYSHKINLLQFLLFIDALHFHNLSNFLIRILNKEQGKLLIHPLNQPLTITYSSSCVLLALSTPRQITLLIILHLFSHNALQIYEYYLQCSLSLPLSCLPLSICISLSTLSCLPLSACISLYSLFSLSTLLAFSLILLSLPQSCCSLSRCKEREHKGDQTTRIWRVQKQKI